MKKYIKPSIKKVEIESTAILADSDPQNMDILGGGNGTDALSKGSGGLFWDDED